MRVLLADDHGIVRRGMKALLELEPGVEIAGEAADGPETLRLCETLRPDLAIVDIAMPRLNGIEVTARALKQDPRLKVIILSMYADEAYVVRALSAGARAYLLKEATEEDLLPAVRAVASGRSFFSPAVSRLLLEDYVRHLKQRGLEDSFHLLTDREKEVLQLLAEGRSNKEAAAALGVGVSTVETHRANLMQKLNLRNTAEIVLYAVRKRVVV
jgi:DNA-binding NarL/FixJ family response regulator